MRTLAALLIAAATLAPLTAGAQSNIGVAAVVVRDVTGTLGATATRQVNVGTDIRQNEVIATGPDSRTQLIFADETVLTIGPDSRLIMDSMVYDPSTTTGEMVVDATQGVFRFVSGRLASSGYTIRTPVGTIGIRGTVFDLIVEATGATTVILLQGIIELVNSAGVGQRLDTPGLATTLVSGDAAPTPPAPPSPETLQKTTGLSPQGTPGAGAGTPDVAVDAPGIPVDRQDVTETADELGMPGAGGMHESEYP